VTFNSHSVFNASIKFSDSNESHITGTGNNFLILESITIETSGNNDTLINIIDGSFSALQNRFFSTGTGNTCIMVEATTPTRSVVVSPAIMQGFDYGIDLCGTLQGRLSPVIFIAAVTSNGNDIHIGEHVGKVIISDINTTTTDTSNFIKIDSAFTGTLKIRDVSNSGTGGFFDTTGINQNSKYVNLNSSGNEFNSNSYVFFHWNGNDSVTSVTDGVYGDLAISATSINTNDTIRFDGNDNEKGSFIYTGVNSARLKLETNLWTNILMVKQLCMLRTHTANYI